MKAIFAATLISLFTTSAFAIFAPQAGRGFDVSCQNEKMEIAVRLAHAANEEAAVRITDFETGVSSAEISVVPMIKKGAQVFAANDFKLAVIYGDGQMTGVYTSAGGNEKLVCQTIYHIMNRIED